MIVFDNELQSSYFCITFHILLTYKYFIPTKILIQTLDGSKTSIFLDRESGYEQNKLLFTLYFFQYFQVE